MQSIVPIEGDMITQKLGKYIANLSCKKIEVAAAIPTHKSRMPRGQPPKCTRNISGLRNQQRSSVDDASESTKENEELLADVESVENLSTDNKSKDDSGEIPTESGRFFFSKHYGCGFQI